VSRKRGVSQTTPDRGGLSGISCKSEVLVALTLLTAGLLMASCSSGPSQSEKAACGPILKLALPNDLGQTGGTNSVGEEGIALPDQMITNLTHSGNSALVRAGDEIKHSPSDAEFVDAVNSAKVECRKLGA
jgi:hypothetical protein